MAERSRREEAARIWTLDPYFQNLNPEKTHMDFKSNSGNLRMVVSSSMQRRMAIALAEIEIPAAAEE